jgi:hypothetical protein
VAARKMLSSSGVVDLEYMVGTKCTSTVSVVFPRRATSVVYVSFTIGR